MRWVFKLSAKILGIILVLVLTQNPAWAQEKVFKKGDKGSEITVIQQNLNKLGYAKKAATGVYDKETVRAVKNFQKKNKLPSTGQTDAKTYQAIANAVFKLPGATQPDESLPGASPNSNAVLKTASQYLGVPYRYGGLSPQGFDCSGYVMYVFEKNRKKLPRTADQQFKAGTKVDKAKLKEGDLVFFTTGEPGPSHVGIYYGANKFIHASTSKGVMISSLGDVYWKPRYIGARRVL